MSVYLDGLIAAFFLGMVVMLVIMIVIDEGVDWWRPQPPKTS